MIRIGRHKINPIPCMREYAERLAESLRPVPVKKPKVTTDLTHRTSFFREKHDIKIIPI